MRIGFILALITSVLYFISTAIQGYMGVDNGNVLMGYMAGFYGGASIMILFGFKDFYNRTFRGIYDA